MIHNPKATEKSVASMAWPEHTGVPCSERISTGKSEKHAGENMRKDYAFDDLSPQVCAGTNCRRHLKRRMAEKGAKFCYQCFKYRNGVRGTHHHPENLDHLLTPSHCVV